MAAQRWWPETALTSHVSCVLSLVSLPRFLLHAHSVAGKSQNCPGFCPNDMGNPPLFDCTGGNYCCASMWKNCCNDSSAQVLRLGNKWKIIGSIGPTGFVPLSTTAAASMSSTATAATITTSTATSTTPTPTPDPTPAPSTVNVGAIAGGVVGGVAALGLLGLAIFLRRRKKRGVQREAPGGGQNSRQDWGSYNGERPKEMMATPASQPLYVEMESPDHRMSGDPRRYRPVELPNWN